MILGGGGGGGGFHGGGGGDGTHGGQQSGGGGGGGLSYVLPKSLFRYFTTSTLPSQGEVTLSVGGAAAFTCKGRPEQFVVPAGVTRLTVDAIGAAGGTPGNPSVGLNSGKGGIGGRTTSTVPVTPGETLTVSVGCAGSGSGGFGGGRGGDQGKAHASSQGRTRWRRIERGRQGQR
jgi:hypothetical protein